MKITKEKRIIVCCVICAIVIIGLIFTLVLSSKNRQAQKKNQEQESSFLAETEESTEVVEEDYNFVIFGVDTFGYTPEDVGRSDIIMCVNISPADEKINLISILRDSKVPIEGMEPQKINAAYQAGGPELALKTINENYHTDFKDYLTMNFQDLVFLVDDIGGIDVEISDLEAETINSMVWLDISEEGRNAFCEDLYGGVAHLDGMQAIMFARTRSIDSDYWRAWRQHRTLRAIREKVLTMSPAEYPALVRDLFDNVVETSLSLDDVLQWMNKDIVHYELTSTIIPDPDYETDVVGGPDETGWWVWQYDLEAASKRINSILNEEE